MNKNLISIPDYAQLCGVSDTVIRKRIDKGEIKAIDSENGMLIDKSKYKPEGKRNPGRPTIRQKLATA